MFGQADHGLCLGLAADLVEGGTFSHGDLVFGEVGEDPFLARRGPFAAQHGQCVLDALARVFPSLGLSLQVGEVGGPFQRFRIGFGGEGQDGPAILQADRQRLAPQAEVVAQPPQEIGIGVQSGVGVGHARLTGS